MDVDALSVVLDVKLQDEVYRLRKRCFLPYFLTADDNFWDELRQAADDKDNEDNEVNGGPVTLAAAIMEYAYKHSLQETLTKLTALCKMYGLPSPGTWSDCDKAVHHVIEFNVGCHSNQEMFGDIGQQSYWTDHRRLFLFLGLLRNNQDHSDMGGDTWTDKIFDHPGLRARQLVNVHNGFDGFSISEEDWYDEDEWPFSMDAEMNPLEM